MLQEADKEKFMIANVKLLQKCFLVCRRLKSLFSFYQRGRVNTSASTLTAKPPTESGELYLVLYDFTPQHVDEVPVKAGDVITVIEKADDGWFTMATNDSRKVFNEGLVSYRLAET